MLDWRVLHVHKGEDRTGPGAGSDTLEMSLVSQLAAGCSAGAGSCAAPAAAGGLPRSFRKKLRSPPSCTLACTCQQMLITAHCAVIHFLDVAISEP